METPEIIAYVEEHHGDVPLVEGFEEALLGVARRARSEPVACYDYDRALELLLAAGLSREQAVQHLDQNVLKSWMGPRTPVFLRNLRKE